MEKNPARIALPQTQRSIQRVPTHAEVRKLLDALAKESRHYRPFYHLLTLYTGCRRGEQCALQAYRAAAQTLPSLLAELRETVSTETRKPLSEYTVEGVHATLFSILSDAVEGGFLRHNPAWRTYRYAGRKTEKKIADAETVGKIISALEDESIKYETYFKLMIATGMRRGECCALQWGDIDWEQRSIHICGTR